jgi:hypothetical protein
MIFNKIKRKISCKYFFIIDPLFKIVSQKKTKTYLLSLVKQDQEQLGLQNY